MPVVRVIQIRTVEPNGPVVDYPETFGNNFQVLEIFIRRAYKKPPAAFDLHIHHNHFCTGHSELTPRTFDAHMRANQIFPGSITKCVYYVCFIPRIAPAWSTTAAVPGPTALSTPSIPWPMNFGYRTETPWLPRGNELQALTPHRGVDFQPRWTTLQGTSANTNPGTKRPGETRRMEPEKRLKLSTYPAGFSASQTTLPPTIVSGDHYRHPVPQWPASDHNIPPWGSTPASTGIPSRGHPDPPHAPKRDLKTCYEFLLLKRIPRKRLVLVGIFAPSKQSGLRPSFNSVTPKNGPLRCNAVAIRLDPSPDANIYHRLLDQDIEGRYLQRSAEVKHAITRAVRRSWVKYFPEIEMLKEGSAMRDFLLRYGQHLLRGKSYAEASIIDLGDDGEDGGEGGSANRPSAQQKGAAVPGSSDPVPREKAPANFLGLDGSAERLGSDEALGGLRGGGHGHGPTTIRPEEGMADAEQQEATRKQTPDSAKAEPTKKRRIPTTTAGMARRFGAPVTLSIEFTDHVDMRDHSLPLDFKKSNVSVGADWKPSKLMNLLRELVEDETLNRPERLLTEERQNTLTGADLVVSVKVGVNWKTWLRSWKPDSADLRTESVGLLRRLGEPVNVKVEMWRNGSQKERAREFRALGRM